MDDRAQTIHPQSIKLNPSNAAIKQLVAGVLVLVVLAALLEVAQTAISLYEASLMDWGVSAAASVKRTCALAVGAVLFDAMLATCNARGIPTILPKVAGVGPPPLEENSVSRGAIRSSADLFAVGLPFLNGLEKAHEKLHYDFYYIKNFSPWLDLVIVMRTNRTMLTGFGAK